MNRLALASMFVLGLALSGPAWSNCPLVANNPESTPDSRFLRIQPVAAQPVVEDLVTGLVWQGCEAGVSGADCDSGSALLVDWSAALQLADSSSYGGFDDWRLPSARELQSLIETGCSGPTLNTTVFPIDLGAEVWSSSGLAQAELGFYPRAWWVSFASGERRAGLKSEPRRVRLVRSGKGLAEFDSGADFTPDPLSLAVQRGVALTQAVEFGPLLVSGIDTPVGVAVDGDGEPQFAINGGAYGSAPGIVRAGDLLRVRHTSASQSFAQTISRLRVGSLQLEAESVTANNDATLAALTLSAGSLQPAFSPAILEYALVVDNSVDSTRLTATLGDPAATLRIAGNVAASGVASDALPLAPGSNLIEVEVLAEDGVTRGDYSVLVERARAASSTALVSSADSVLPGESVTFTATVEGDAPGATVAFLADGVSLAGCAAQPLTSSDPRRATCATSALAAGQTTIRAEYSGDPANLPSSAEITQTVNSPPSLSVPEEFELLEDAQSLLAFSVSDAESAAGDLDIELSVSADALFERDALQASLAGTGANRTLLLAPRADAFGSAVLTLRVSDPLGGATEAEVSIEVLAVNDPPSVTLPKRLVHTAAAAGPRQVIGFASDLSTGPANEASQRLSFSVRTLADPAGVVEALSISESGDLDYRLSGQGGVARFEVQATDNGGRAQGGEDAAEPARLRVFVGPGSDIETEIQRLLPVGADLSTLVSSGAASGEFLLRVRNHGPDDVPALSLRVDAQRGLGSVLWQCNPPVGCLPAQGSGRVLTGFSLSADSELQMTLSGDWRPEQFHLVLDAWAQAAAGALVGLEDDRQVLVEALHPEAIFYSGLE